MPVAILGPHSPCRPPSLASSRHDDPRHPWLARHLSRVPSLAPTHHIGWELSAWGIRSPSSECPL
jgi:hypothetical protein